MLLLLLLRLLLPLRVRRVLRRPPTVGLAALAGAGAGEGAGAGAGAENGHQLAEFFFVLDPLDPVGPIVRVLGATGSFILFYNVKITALQQQVAYHDLSSVDMP